jgi:hypothetical protein
MAILDMGDALTQVCIIDTNSNVDESRRRVLIKLTNTILIVFAGYSEGSK